MALFMYPHSITATLSSKSRNTIRRNSAILPAYSFVLGLLALLGLVAIAAGTKPIGLDGKPNAQLVVPQLFEDMFPSWFADVAFTAIAIDALVPEAIMSIAAVNLFTRTDGGQQHFEGSVALIPGLAQHSPQVWPVYWSRAKAWIKASTTRGSYS